VTESLISFRELRETANAANGGLWVWSENRKFIETFSPEVVRALLDVVEAAIPLSRLPFPVSSDERDDWRVYQQKLKEALARGER
jgi:hypothetical protein